MLRKFKISDMVNRSILQTLNRSINTVVTVLISITTVYIFAKIYNISSVAEFSFPLIIGIASGGYSSIFIASPLWVIWKEHQEKRRISKRIKPARA
jgi:preprotein translocase subunit SecF